MWPGEMRAFNDVLCVGLSPLAWQQHDVQELCRVMFDALEQKWKQTVQVRECSSQAALQCYIRTRDLVQEKGNGSVTQGSWVH